MLFWLSWHLKPYSAPKTLMSVTESSNLVFKNWFLNKVEVSSSLSISSLASEVIRSASLFSNLDKVTKFSIAFLHLKRNEQFMKMGNMSHNLVYLCNVRRNLECRLGYQNNSMQRNSSYSHTFWQISEFFNSIWGNA